ncbi:MAG TPA: YHS domain-containing protein [Dehalococcoidia bacterium]|nr:YHS domain-containing protein [Dehalococcoidia bacterium]
MITRVVEEESVFTASLNLEGLQSMLPKDPVCGMTVEIDKAAGLSVHRGTTYYFCALACKQQFDADPDKYVAKAAKT